MNPAAGSAHAGILRTALVSALLFATASAQQTKPDATPASLNESLTELQAEVHELKGLVQQLKQETTTRPKWRPLRNTAFA